MSGCNLLFPQKFLAVNMFAWILTIVLVSIFFPLTGPSWQIFQIPVLLFLHFSFSQDFWWQLSIISKGGSTCQYVMQNSSSSVRLWRSLWLTVKRKEYKKTYREISKSQTGYNKVGS